MVDHTDTGGSGDTFAGNGYDSIRWLAIDMPGWYQVCTEASGWLDPVYGYNKSDLMWGCAGDGSPITRPCACYYETQDPNKTGWLVAEYDVNGLPNMHDLTDTGALGTTTRATARASPPSACRRSHKRLRTAARL